MYNHILPSAGLSPITLCCVHYYVQGEVTPVGTFRSLGSHYQTAVRSTWNSVKSIFTLSLPQGIFGRVYHVKTSKNYKWIHLINIVWNSFECVPLFQQKIFVDYPVLTEIFFHKFLIKYIKFVKINFGGINPWIIG